MRGGRASLRVRVERFGSKTCRTSVKERSIAVFSSPMKRAQAVIVTALTCIGLAQARPIGPVENPNPGGGRAPGRFEQMPEPTSPAFHAARYYSENSFFDQALASFEQVLAESIGTVSEPTARLMLASEYENTINFRPKDPTYKASLIAKYQEQLDQVVQRFPGTTYAFVAKAMRFETMPTSHFDLDPALAEVGGRPIAEIIDDVPDRPFHERMVREEFRYHVAEAYSNLLVKLSEEDRTKLQLFLIESFPYSDGYSSGKDFFRGNLIPDTMSIDALPPGMPTEPDSLPPHILSRYPEQGQSTGPLPEIRVTMVDGDYWARQADSRTSRLFLDGVDVTDFSFWKARFDTTGTGPNFQELTVLYTPLLPLPPGEHSLELLASDGTDGNSQTYQWTFTVAIAPPPPTTENLPATKDALVYEKSPHSNEGANPRLTLEKINGKAARNLLGFDLSGVYSVCRGYSQEVKDPTLSRC